METSKMHPFVSKEADRTWFPRLFPQCRDQTKLPPDGLQEILSVEPNSRTLLPAAGQTCRRSNPKLNSLNSGSIHYGEKALHSPPPSA